MSTPKEWAPAGASCDKFLIWIVDFFFRNDKAQIAKPFPAVKR
jgi:hypothetical protein